MAKRLKWSKHEPRKKDEVVEVDHLEVVEEVVDLEAEIVAGLEVGIEEMIVGMIEEEEVVEPASIVTERVIWQEIAMKVIEGIADEVAGVVLEAEVVEEIEHVTIATKRVTWLENARKKIAEIVEDDRHKFIPSMKGLQPPYHLSSSFE